MGNRLLDSLTPAEIKIAVAAEMAERGRAESYEILGAVAKRCDSSQENTGQGYKWEQQRIADRYFGRVKRALEVLVADLALVKDPGKGYRGAPVYYTPKAWQDQVDARAKRLADERARTARWDLITVRLGTHGFHLDEHHSMSAASFEQLADALDRFNPDYEDLNRQGDSA